MAAQVPVGRGLVRAGAPGLLVLKAFPAGGRGRFFATALHAGDLAEQVGRPSGPRLAEAEALAGPA